jgi:hypothetical protein
MMTDFLFLKLSSGMHYSSGTPELSSKTITRHSKVHLITFYGAKNKNHR